MCGGRSGMGNQLASSDDVAAGGPSLATCFACLTYACTYMRSTDMLANNISERRNEDM